MKPTKEQFQAYVDVQMSGITNMFAVNNVIKLASEYYDTELDKDTCVYIMQNYADLKAEYGQAN